jgi:hypothetical protein
MRILSVLNTLGKALGFRAHADMADHTVYTWPAQDGSSGDMLTTDGAGTLAFAAAPSEYTLPSDVVRASTTSLVTTHAYFGDGNAAGATCRAMALGDLPQIATQRAVGRNTAGTGVPEEVTAAQLLRWGFTEHTVDYNNADLYVAATSANTILFTPAANEIILIVVLITTPIAGMGKGVSYNVTIGDLSDLDVFASFDAIANKSVETKGPVAIVAARPVRFYASSSVNLNTATSGQVKIYALRIPI